MFESILATLKGQEDKSGESRRRFPRRECDKCVTVIGGKTYPVENWSQVGVLIYGDSRPFALNDQIDVMMKFKLRNDIIDIAHKAKVVRKTYDKVAFEFEPLSDQIKKGFQSVIDDYVATEFADSQLSQ